MSDTAPTFNVSGKPWPKPTGRPSKYTDGIAAEIVARLSSGEALAVICRDDHMPTDRAIRDWAESRTDLSSAIAHAREAGHDAIASKLRLTARGKTPEQGGDSTGDVARDKLIIETDLKLLAKWNPKRYGDNMQVRHADADGEKLDTKPMVNELLGMMAGQVKADEPIDVTPSRVITRKQLRRGDWE